MSASISGLVVEYIVAIDVTRVRFPADATFLDFVGVVRQGASQRVAEADSKLRWSSGYDARLTRERSPVQSWDRVLVLRGA